MTWLLAGLSDVGKQRYMAIMTPPPGLPVSFAFNYTQCISHCSLVLPC